MDEGIIPAMASRRRTSAITLINIFVVIVGWLPEPE
jgi:hypothetical protein